MRTDGYSYDRTRRSVTGSILGMLLVVAVVVAGLELVERALTPSSPATAMHGTSHVVALWH